MTTAGTHKTRTFQKTSTLSYVYVNNFSADNRLAYGFVLVIVKNKKIKLLITPADVYYHR